MQWFLKSAHRIYWLIGISLAIIFLIVEDERVGDLFIYLSASQNLFTSPNLYHEMYGKTNFFFHLGNPFLTFILYPFCFLTKVGVAYAFKLLYILALIRIFHLFNQHFLNQELKVKSKNIILLISYLSAFYFIFDNLHLVQFTILILWMCLEALTLIWQGKHLILAAALLAFSILIKPLGIVFLPYLLYRAHFKVFAWSILFLVVLMAFPSLFLGWEKNQFLWQEWWSVLHQEDAIFDMNNRKNQGLSAFLSSLFIKDLPENVEKLSHRRHLLHLGKETVIYLIYISRAALILLSLYVLQLPFFKKEISRRQFHFEIAYLSLCIPLIFPQQRNYNFIFLLPAISYLSADWYERWKSKKINSAYSCLMLFTFILANLELLLGLYRYYYWYHKSLTYLSLIYLGLLLFNKPQKRLSKKPSFLAK